MDNERMGEELLEKHEQCAFVLVPPAPAIVRELCREARRAREENAALRKRVEELEHGIQEAATYLDEDNDAKDPEVEAAITVLGALKP